MLCYLNDGMLEEAKPLATELHEYKCKTLGDLHPKTVYSYCLMLCCIDMVAENYGAMIDKCSKMIEKLRETDDAEGFAAMCLYADILCSYYDSPAIDEYEAIYAWMSTLGNKDDANLAYLLELLLTYYYEFDMYDEAERVNKELCDLYRLDESIWNKNYVLCQYNLARNAFLNKKYDKAAEYLYELYSNDKQFLKDKGMYAHVCYNMSLCYIHIKEFDNAVIFADMACKLYESNKNFDHGMADNYHRLLERAERLKICMTEGQSINNVGGFLLMKWMDIWASVI